MLRRTWWLWTGMLLGACAPGNSGLIITGVVAPNDSCVLDISNPNVSLGVLDTATTPRVEYTLHPRLANQLINLGQSGTTGVPMADPNVMNLREAQVELRDVADQPLALPGLPNPYTVPASGFIPSSDGTTIGEGIGTIQIIPPIYGEAMRDLAGSRIVAVVQAIGVTAGNAEVISPPFHWPIELCSGCLFACVMDDEGVAQCMPSCFAGQDDLTISPAACGGEALGCVTL